MPGLDDEQAEFFRRFFGIPLPTPKQQQPNRKPQQEEQNRRQCRWSDVRPELLRLVNRGKPITANKQFALAA